MVAAVAAGFVGAGAGTAEAYWDRGYGPPRGYYGPPRGYYAPPPPPVYYAPRPIYVPRPVYVPPPVYYGPPRGYYGGGWGGPRHGHGHRRW